MEQKLRLEWIDPRTLKPNPSNFRTHPDQQKKLLSAVLDEVGWAGCILLNEATGHIIDGHARREDAIRRKDSAVPVLVGSWSEADERKILATFDPISAMAGQIEETYRELLGQVQTENQDLQTWCDNLILELSPPDEDLDDIPSFDEKPEVQLECCPKCGFEWKRS